MNLSHTPLRRALALAICAGLAGPLLPAGAASPQPFKAMDPGRVEMPGADGRRSSPNDMPGTLEMAPGTVSPQGPLIDADKTPQMPATNSRPFLVREVVLEGSTSYPPSTFRPLLATLEGRKVTLAEVNAVAAKITRRYREAGFPLVRTFVPVQRLDEGVLRLRVVEGRINQVEIQGESSRAMRAYAENIRQEAPLKRSTLERNLLLMNDLPGNQVHGTLSASPVREGTDLTADNSEFKRWDGFIGADNRDSRYFGPWQAYGGVGLNNPLGLGDRLSVRYGHSLEGNEMAFYEGQYELPVNAQGTTLSLLAQHSDGHADTFSFLNAKSSGDTFVARLTHPWIRSRAENFNTSVAFTWFNGKSRYFDEPDLPPSSDDRIRALRVGASYDFVDQYGGRNLFKAELSQGLDVMGASHESRLNPSRYEGQTDFTKLQFDAQRLQDMSWITEGLNLYLALTGQTSFGDALLTPEQFGVGGSQFGRGYDPSEIAGDKGLAGKVELQYNRYHEFFRHPVPTQYYGYWDVGKVWNEKPRYVNSESLASAGFGAHFQVASDTYVSPELAFPLTRSVSAEELHDKNGKSPRFYLNLLKLF
ncbi:ShlB/FhaC/HecB family hemolysin secretion/activation protein [Pseudomonas sp. RW407]|uniref:ShlB/FhaC/HecB family hemolysin secretion/activation protein n=1 Tax=Pseudomonas sp. RW407 TaxID=2202894 RepID=UPI000D6F30CE|nr:ShlB/FhaC/HecB family hemolysin secretion/activation protein [Pseudomonas sp. RW407]PWU30833.1 ShlB/FhaC/HecB family hemolysin secretion/activation protein [Pseudomonas sp. RW407]